MSLRMRLTIWYSGVLAIMLLAFGIALYYFISTSTIGSVKETLEKQGNTVVSQMKVVPFRQYRVIPFPELTDFRVAGMFMQIVNTEGEVKTNFSSQLRLPFDMNNDFERAQDQQSWFRQVHSDNTNLLIYHVRMVYDNEVIGILQVASEISSNLRYLDNLRYTLILSWLLVVAAAATFGSYMARKALRPVEDVINAANRIGKGEDLEQRIEHSGARDEIGRLTSTINEMLARLESAYKELDNAYRLQRRFVSDASHE